LIERSISMVTRIGSDNACECPVDLFHPFFFERLGEAGEQMPRNDGRARESVLAFENEEKTLSALWKPKITKL
jgi:hypothetical protein